MGIGDNTVDSKNSPVLVEALADTGGNDPNVWVGIQSVSCGHYHTVALTLAGEVWAWGEVSCGALGVVGVDNAYKPVPVQVAQSTMQGSMADLGNAQDKDFAIVQVSAGARHTLFLDKRGMVYACGENEYGQLGMSVRDGEPTPTQLPNFNGSAAMIAAGFKHSLVLTKSGLVYAFGSNSENELGCPQKRASTLPICVQEIAHIPMRFIAAGSFSASIAADSGSMYLWGNGTFGEFATPHRVKKIEQPVVAVSVGDQFGACLTEPGKDGGQDCQRLYTWGVNQAGQLGTGDYEGLGTPAELTLPGGGKHLNHVACGSTFAIALSQTAQTFSGCAVLERQGHPTGVTGLDAYFEALKKTFEQGKRRVTRRENELRREAKKREKQEM